MKRWWSSKIRKKKMKEQVKEKKLKLNEDNCKIIIENGLFWWREVGCFRER